MKLESGPAAYDRNYYIVFLVLCTALGVYFLYDYAIGYPNKNREQAKRQLTPIVGSTIDPTTLPDTPTHDDFRTLAETAPSDPGAVRERFGEPLVTRPAETGETLEYFASTYGMAVVPIVNGRVEPTRMQWTTWHKTADEIKLQLYCALICFVVGIYVVYRVARAATLRAVIDDQGMTYGGRRIPFTSMLRLCDYSKKGWVDLYYRDGAQERKLRIDNQKIRKFDEIIDTLCESKGFDDPRPATEQPGPDQESEADAPSAQPVDPPAPTEPDAPDSERGG